MHSKVHSSVQHALQHWHSASLHLRRRGLGRRGLGLFARQLGWQPWELRRVAKIFSEGVVGVEPPPPMNELLAVGQCGRQLRQHICPIQNGVLHIPNVPIVVDVFRAAEVLRCQHQACHAGHQGGRKRRADCILRWWWERQSGAGLCFDRQPVDTQGLLGLAASGHPVRHPLFAAWAGGRPRLGAGRPSRFAACGNPAVPLQLCSSQLSPKRLAASPPSSSRWHSASEWSAGRLQGRLCPQSCCRSCCHQPHRCLLFRRCASQAHATAGHCCLREATPASKRQVRCGGLRLTGDVRPHTAAAATAAAAAQLAAATGAADPQHSLHQPMGARPTAHLWHQPSGCCLPAAAPA